jgi:glycosyltransferase involved in cell wall biosynthesis
VGLVRILFLHEVNYLEKPIYEMHEFPEHLAAKGHQVAFVHFPEGWDKARINLQGWKSQVNGRVLKDEKIILYTPQFASGSIIGRFCTAINFFGVFREIQNDFRPDIIVSYSVPTSGWQALSIARKNRIPVVFRALDVSHRIRQSVFSFLIKAAERYVFSKATHVSANNPELASYAISLGSAQDRTSVEKPPLDFKHFSLSVGARNRRRAQLGIPYGSQVVLYMGSFFYFSGLPEVLRDFARSDFSNTYLVLIGGGEQDELLRTLAKAHHLEDRVIFTGFVDFQDLPEYLSIADVAINPMIPSQVSNLALPNKVLQYLACGLPVVTFELPGLESSLKGLSALTIAEPGKGIWHSVEDMLSAMSQPGKPQGASDQLTKAFSVEATIGAFENLLIRTLTSSHE